jgi:radical SAM superfamily enzyme
MAGIINQIDADSIKIHSLHVPYGTKLYEMYQNGEFEIISKEAYFNRLDILLQNIRPTLPVQRLFSRAPEKSAAFCNWGTSWWKLEDEYFARKM